MREDFLHYLWKFKKFIDHSHSLSRNGLRSVQAQKIRLLSVGQHNHLAGPDFFNAKLYVGSQLWAGNVEIHIKSSDWYLHGHENDPAYNNVILHVVWDHDCEIYRLDNTVVPTLCLQEYVSKDALNNYQNLFARQSQKWILCQHDVEHVPERIKNDWLERLFYERLARKTEHWYSLAKTYENDWEYILFVLLARNFGTKINAEAFEAMARSISPATFRKASKEAFQLEAIFFGLSGIIPANSVCSYALQLEGEFEYLKHKYKIVIPQLGAQFFKLRPVNFPTIRLSQLANLYNGRPSLFQLLMKQDTKEGYYDILKTKAASYWDTHYSFGTQQKKVSKTLTRNFIDILLINCILPLRFMYEKSLGVSGTSKVFDIMHTLKPEKNAIIEAYRSFKLSATNALDSQALLELKSHYCEKHRCLDCAIGNAIVGSKD